MQEESQDVSQPEESTGIIKSPILDKPAVQNDSRGKSETDLKISNPTEANIVFEKTQKKLEIKDRLDHWFEEQTPLSTKRMSLYGIDAEKTKEQIMWAKRSMLTELRDLTNEETFAMLREKAQKLFLHPVAGKEEDAQLLQGLLNSTSINSLLDLLIRKLDGNISPSETKFLEALQYIYKGDFRHGSHDVLLNRIGISLLTPKSLQESTTILHHELTHMGLAIKFPKLVFWSNDIKFGIDTDSSFAIKKQFVSFLEAINESAAFRVGQYFEGKVPNYESYQSKIHPSIFKEVYLSINALAQGRDLEKFDEALIDVCNSFINSFNQEITPDNYKQAVVAFIKRCKVLSNSK